VDYVVRDLGITPGPVTLLVGTGFSAKTLLAMRLGLSVSADVPFLGMETARGKVLHLDLEQGGVETSVRYRRLSVGLGLRREEVCDLKYVEFPKLRLDDPGAEEQLAEALAGRKLCIIDSLRAAMRASENSSDSREHVDMLSRVSCATSCAVILIHHSGKGRSGGVRGSSAFFDAASTVLVAKKHRDGSIQVTQTKTRTVHFDGLRFAVRDAGPFVEAIGRREGLQLHRVTDASTGSEAATLDERIISVLKMYAGNGVTAAQLFAEVGGRRAHFLAARRGLVEAGKVRLMRLGRETIHFLREENAVPEPRSLNAREPGTASRAGSSWPVP